MTRPEQSGERRNSGLGGYTLRSPSMGYDTFSPDRMFCDKLASKIIQNFDLKFMRDNAGLHDEIVSILEAHKFQEAMLRFVFIPAEHVVQFTINKDGIGKGHSMLEPPDTCATTISACSPTPRRVSWSPWATTTRTSASTISITASA